MKIAHISGSALNQNQKDEISNFLFKHLEQYGDPIWQINKCIEYAQNPDKGGDIFTARSNEDELLGVVVTNKTGMDGYIPANILVYIAVDGKTRGHGIGDRLIKMVKDKLTGGIALHVEPHNPAKRLYERNGFTNKYLEMRFQ
jgi:ribosomal-protein-alanine N-acetyltransferase